MTVNRRAKALDDLTDHATYIASDDPEASDRFLDAFAASVDRLAQMPNIGVAQHNENPALFGMRRWPIKGFEKYVIFYLVLEGTVDIVRVLHASQDLERILQEE